METERLPVASGPTPRADAALAQAARVGVIPSELADLLRELELRAEQFEREANNLERVRDAENRMNAEKLLALDIGNRQLVAEIAQLERELASLKALSPHPELAAIADKLAELPFSEWGAADARAVLGYVRLACGVHG